MRMRTIIAEELKDKFDANEDFILVNVLSHDSFETRHIPKSINIPLAEIGRRSKKELPDKNKETIVYCASRQCEASPNAAKKLEKLGYTDVVDFEEGLEGWQDAGFEFEGRFA